MLNKMFNGNIRWSKGTYDKATEHAEMYADHQKRSYSVTADNFAYSVYFFYGAFIYFWSILALQCPSPFTSIKWKTAGKPLLLFSAEE